MRTDGLVNAINLIQRAFHGWWTGYLARHPDGKEQRVKTAFAHARDVYVAVVVSGSDIEGVVEQQPLRGVVMRIDDDRALVNLLRTHRHLRVNENCKGQNAEADEAAEANDNEGDPPH